MKLEKIVTLANKVSELRFLAMVRSLRNVQCQLPVWVIPYDDNLFELPDNCVWWKLEEVSLWLDANHCHETMRKYQCLLISNYQFVDSDVIFLKNPETTLSQMTGFVTSCCHWNNPGHTYTDESIKYFRSQTTTWQKNIFNSGQFACDSILFDFKTLKKTSENDLFRYTCLNFPYHEQPGLNLLVSLSNIPVSNLTLPPFHMESTHADDYKGEFEKYWADDSKKPYFIHWAGCDMTKKRPIDELFTSYLTPLEASQWHARLADQRKTNGSLVRRLKRGLRKIKLAAGVIRMN